MPRPKNSKDYWKWRQARRMYEKMNDADKVGEDITRLYAVAARELTEEVEKVFYKYQQKWGLSHAQAKKLLEKVRGKKTIDVLKAMIPYVDEKVRKDFQVQIEAGAYSYRIRRLEDTMAKLDEIMTEIYRQDERKQREHYVKFAEDSYNREMYEIQKQTGLFFSFSEISEDAINKIVNRKWSGKSFSENIWENTQAVADSVRDALLVEVMCGMKQEGAARAIAERFMVGAGQSRRIIRTESNYISGQIQQDAYEECGAEKYIYIATLDSKTDEECGRLDGTVHLVKDQMPGTNMHPMHPNCRCTTGIYIDEKTLEGLQRRSRNPHTGEVEMVPATMTYKEWAHKHGLDQPKPKKERKSAAKKPAAKKAATKKEAPKPKKEAPKLKEAEAPAKPKEVKKTKPAETKKAAPKKPEFQPDELDLRLQREYYQRFISNGKTPEDADRLARNVWKSKDYDKVKAKAMETQKAKDYLMETMVKSGKTSEEARKAVDELDKQIRADRKKRSDAAKKGWETRKSKE